MRRLFPALSVMMLLSTIAGALVLSPERFMALAVSGASAILSVSNIYFFFNSDYFDAAAETQIFLHTWSLAVEEQFYLFWPLLISSLVAFLTRENQLKFVLLLGIFGTVLSYIGTIFDPSLALYITPFRLTEFSIGAVLCWINTEKIKNVWLREGIVSVFLLALLMCFSLIDSDVSASGILFLIPCIATAGLIWSGQNSNVATALLANPLMTYLGRISYSLYLYHWPIIIFYKYQVGLTLLAQDRLAIFVIALIFAAVSHRLVESPLRRPVKFWESNRQVAIIYVTGVIVLTLVFTWIYFATGFPQRTQVELRVLVNDTTQEKQRRFDLHSGLCATRSWEHCADRSDNLPNVLIVGDSHGIDALNILGPHYPELHFILDSEGGCPALTLSDLDLLIKPNHPNYTKCQAQSESLADPSSYLGISYLILSQRYTWYTPEHLDHFLVTLPPGLAGKVLVFGNSPTFKENLPELILRHGQRAGLSSFAATYLADETWGHEKSLAAVELKNGYRYVSKSLFYCDEERQSCRIFYQPNNKLLTYDKHHLGIDAASALSNGPQ